MKNGRFPRLNDRDSLWRILLSLAARKCATVVEHECRIKRGGGNVVGEVDLKASGDGGTVGELDDILSSDPTPEFAVLMAEQCEWLLSVLTEPVLQEVAQLKLEGYLNTEIAKRLECSLRAVERKLMRIRSEWSAVMSDAP